MADVDLLRHWGRREYVDEEGSGDSDSEFGNGPLFTIQEDDGESEFSSEDEEDEAEEDLVVMDPKDQDNDIMDVYDQEYGNEDDTDDDLEDELTDVNIKNLYGDSDTETTLHDSTANSTSTNNNTQQQQQQQQSNSFNNSLLQDSQPSHRMGSHNYIPAAATSSSANGKYRTVSVFGGILDLADPTDGDDSFSSDGFSDDDWSVEETPKRSTTRKAINNNNNKSRPLASSTVSNNHHQVKNERIPTETIDQPLQQPPPLAPDEEVAGDASEDDDASNDDADTAVGTIITCSTADIPKSIDLSKFIDKPPKEQRGLLQSFLNELCFLRLPEEEDQVEDA